jgi:hypothetical protein
VQNRTQLGHERFNSYELSAKPVGRNVDLQRSGRRNPKQMGFTELIFLWVGNVRRVVQLSTAILLG